MIFSPFSFLNTSISTAYSFSAQALEWQSGIINNGGSISNATLQIFDEYFFKPMVSASLFDELDRINIYVGTGNEIAARTGLISSSIPGTYSVTPVSSPTWNNTQGYRSSGTSYLDLNWTPSLDGKKYQQRFASAFYVAKSPDMTTRRAMGGASTGGLQNNLSRDGTSGGRFLSSLNTSLNSVATAGQQYTGSIMHLAGVSGSGTNNTGSQVIYGPNGLLITGSRSGFSSPSLQNVAQYELTNNNNFTPGGAYETVAFHMASGHGSYRLFLSGSTVNSILQNLFTQLGV